MTFVGDNRSWVHDRIRVNGSRLDLGIRGCIRRRIFVRISW